MTLNKKQKLKFISLFTIKLIIVGIIVATFLSDNYPIWGKIGTILWYTSFIPILIIFLKNLIDISKTSWLNKNFFTLITLLIIFSLIVINSNKKTNISHETTQQAACILEKLNDDQSWGFNHYCFLGYPARQYLVPILPTLIFGRKQIVLNLGFSIYLFFGITIFAKAILDNYKTTKKSDLITAILLTIPLHFYHFNHHLFHQPEQSIFPLSFVFIFVGIFLQYLQKKSELLLLIMGIGLQYFIFSYTTSLAFYGLAISTLIYLMFKSKNNKLKNKYLSVIILSLIGFFISLKIRKDINIFGQHNSSIKIFKEIFNAFEHLIFQNHGFGIFSPVISSICILSLIMALFNYFGWTYLILALWILATVSLSSISQGYAFYGIADRLQRIIIVIPVLLLIINKLIKKFKIDAKLLLIFYILLLITGFRYHQLFFKNKKINHKLESAIWLQQINYSKTDSSIKHTIYLVDKAKDDFLGVNDYLKYFKPEFILKDYSENSQLCNFTSSLYLIEETHPCNKNLITSTVLENLGNYTINNNNYLLISYQSDNLNNNQEEIKNE